MSQQYLQCSHSLIVNVLRAIVSRSISGSPTSSATVTASTSHRTIFNLGRTLPLPILLWTRTSTASRHKLLNTGSSRHFYSTSSMLTSPTLSNYTASVSEYDSDSDMLDSLGSSSSQQNSKTTAIKNKERNYRMVYRPKIEKIVKANHFKEPKRKHITVEDYNKRIIYAVLNDQQNKAINLLREMERRELKPNTITYTTIINGYSRQSDMIRAKRWLMRMRANFVRPDVYTYTSMIDGYMRQCDVDRAEGVFKTMMQQKVPPNLVTYNVLMHHSVLQLDMETATKFWSKLYQVGLEPDVYSYAILIQGLGNEALVDEAWRIYDKMKQQNVNVNHVVATTLMGIHVKHKDNSYAVQLFQDFFGQQPQQEPLVPTGHTRNIILNAAMGHIDLAKLNGYYQQFKSLLDDDDNTDMTVSPIWGDHPKASNNVYTYTSFMRAFLRHNDTGMVSQVYQDMMARNIKPTLVTFGTLMLAHAFVPDPHACENMLKELKSHGIKVNVALYTILMRAWAKAKQWEQVKRVYDEMKADNIQPNKMTMEVLRWAKEKAAI
ncbi:hypothetical protein BC941DRAFT_418086 [Chlamydoabsidia padenii]|nr:hypothetical protein BC941DRAFT_418086 [Chlamydoabsidia padenii]